MEKFIYLFRGGEAHQPGQPKEALQNLVKDMMQWMSELSTKGLLIGGEPLQRTGKQVNGSKKIVTDGPFVEAKEIVGGYVMVNANDLDHAVEISKGCPILENNGLLEVRPIQKM